VANVLEGIFGVEKPIIGGSDAHLSLEIGRVRTVLDDKVDDLEDIRELLLGNKSEIIGTESPQWVHYPSVIIGRIRTRNFGGVVKSVRKVI